VIDVNFTGKKLFPSHASDELRFEVSPKVVARVAENRFPIAASFRASQRRSN
jgi:hypothetical protein